METKQAVDHLDEILAVEGIDGVFIGPVDLGASLGTPLPDELVPLLSFSRRPGLTTGREPAFA